MPVARAEAPSRFYCKEPSRDRTFSTQSNLKRHIQSKHGTPVQMPCGKDLPNHTSNTMRHQKSCGKCFAVLSQHSAPRDPNGTESPPISITHAATGFGFNLDAYTGNFNDMEFLTGDHTFEIY
ncbi:hypothetical protein CCUS01_09700 [Colletotrichum cuscutae]|uniref:Uncharacterized protein n=1 Tax=Colletotrichum cuscutae TaxID=1209917 RepID=A0AAI9UHU2_9PEZI|nr:hypothetical protein CCUS01_09700 [Colletotrichum cuscutae]